MNKLFIIGNLTRDPELRSVANGIPVASFTVAVNRRRASNAEAGQQPEADFFRVTAWRQLGENCNRYLAKGRKVAVVGSVQVSTYTANDGTTRATLEVTADDVEFLSPRGEGDGGTSYQPEQSSSSSTSSSGSTNSGFVKVDDEELPF